MKDKIIKLLDSKILEDILLAIELAYELPVNEFDNIFGPIRSLKLYKYSPLYYNFYRDGLGYSFGSTGLGRGSFDSEYNPIDITPEQFK